MAALLAESYNMHCKHLQHLDFYLFTVKNSYICSLNLVYTNDLLIQQLKSKKERYKVIVIPKNIHWVQLQMP